jgi:hypothetical protein
MASPRLDMDVQGRGPRIEVVLDHGDVVSALAVTGAEVVVVLTNYKLPKYHTYQQMQ